MQDAGTVYPNLQWCCSAVVVETQNGYRVRMGFGKLWKVMEIDNAIFQDLESFGKGRFFKMAMEKF